MKKIDDEKLFLKFINAGRKDCSDFHSWGPGIRNNYIIHYIVKGKGYYSCEGKSFCVCAGQSFIIFPKTVIEYHPDYDDPWEYAWADFSGLEAKTLLQKTDFSVKNPVTPNLGAKPLEYINNLLEFNGYFSEAQRCMASGELHKFLAFYIDSFSNNLHRDEPLAFNKAIEYIDDNLHNSSLSIEGISAVVGINRATLYRIFKKELHMSPGKYILNLRMEKSKKLLAESNMSVKSIAFSVGFSDPLYFSKTFSNETGVCPSDYRKTNI